MQLEYSSDIHKIEYFHIGTSKGGNQDWLTDFWMRMGGCGALAACDISICLAQNYNMKDCCSFPITGISRKAYVDFSSVMKPYIRPRMGGVSKTSIFVEGCRKYFADRGYDTRFMVCEGNQSYEEAEAFIRKALQKNLPVAYLMLKHKDKALADLNWHWFMVTGYEIREGSMQLYYHTYGEEYMVDFLHLWDTGMEMKGGMVAIEHIEPFKNPSSA